MSLSLYVLAGTFRTRAEGNEAALKYFLLGAFASGFFLYGIALLYGATGTTNLARLGAALAAPGAARDPMVLAGLALLLVGFGFKTSAVPFHQWAPDVYQGAPTPWPRSSPPARRPPPSGRSSASWSPCARSRRTG